jgi:dTMP kinase
VPSLQSGIHVICDRYVLSSYAYQTVDVDIDFVRQINTQAPPPDLTLLLEVRPEIAMARIDRSRSERDRFETLDFQRKVADNYRTQLADFAGSPSVVIDGEMAVDEVTAAIGRAVEGIL